jgi:hypothetical protein
VTGRLVTAVLALGATLWLWGCTVDESANPSFGCEACPGQCVMGFCLMPSGAGVGARDGGADGAVGVDGGGLAVGGAADGGGAGGLCDEPGATEFCYEGPSGTATQGRCKAGQRLCEGEQWSACLGQVTPQAEVCNGLDDDCDGDADEALMLGSCTDDGQSGVCRMGQLRCESGVMFCRRAVDPVVEVCNGEDDDCDGDSDEGTDGECYPDGLAGCSDDGEGGLSCQGLCQPGTRQCVGGELEPCGEHVGPQTEACTEPETVSSDEDCDGQVDEGCTCTAEQSCYSGPPGTLGVGECSAGRQSCVDGSFGACEGAVLPAEETCDNEGADDDCNGTADDIPQRGEPCSISGGSAADGVCRDGTLGCASDGGSELTCIPRAPEEESCNGEDDDCDERVDEAFDFSSDESNCGRCGHSCGESERCCGGDCVDVSIDGDNCGRCGMVCGDGLDCCGGDCVDLETDEGNCGECGNRCGDFSLQTCCVTGECKAQLICSNSSDG